MPVNKFTLEQSIIHHLMMQSPFISDFGLLSGKMGISLFFYEYARHENEIIYSDFAGELLDDIWDKVHNRVPISFESGLTGIAWGIEYLIQNNFVEGNSNEICAEIDQYIMKSDIRRLINDKFIKEELGGFLHYILGRFSGSIKQNKLLPFDSLYLADLYRSLSSLLQHNKRRLPTSVQTQILLVLQCLEWGKWADYTFDIFLFVNRLNMSKNIYLCELGIKKGLAGLLFHQMITKKITK